MNIRKVTDDKKAFLDLLLLADEQEDMIERYLARGELFVLEDGCVKGECVVTREADGVYELKNIAVYPSYQRSGCGRALIDHLFTAYSDCETLLVGTGDVPSSLSFYHACGFTASHRIPNFFTDNYGHTMFEDGIQLVDMVYLKRNAERKTDMNKMLAYCGLDCEKCDAHIATVRNDDALREKTAKLWSELNNAPITPEMIHCDGCRVDGVKTPFCECMCEVRKCALDKGLASCAACPDMDGCAFLAPILQSSDEAKGNLTALK